MPKAYKTLSTYAQNYSRCVLMSNYTGQSWGYSGGGQSAFWDENGHFISELNGTDSGLLLIERIDNNWTGKTLKYE